MINHVLNEASILEQFRPLLSLYAQSHLRGRLRQKLDDEDLVQQTLMDAFQNRHQFRGRSEGELFSWLRTILHHNLLDTVQSLQTGKRDLRREVSFHQASFGSDMSSERWPEDECLTPDQFVEQKEQDASLRIAVRKLPSQQREAIEQFYFQEDSLKEVSIQMNRSVEAVSALIYRGLRRLRSILGKQAETQTVLVSHNSSKKLADHQAGCRYSHHQLL